MADFETRRIALPTGVELNVALAGDPANPPIVLLHGFPESHRTWRHQIAALARDHYVIAPDQRGFGYSARPEGVASYTPDKPVADLLALADHLGIGPFTLVGHDWGGAIAWMAALQNPQRIARLIIVNAPHPLVFQRSIFDDPAQRAASQYITAFRNPDFEQFVERIGLETFFDESFAKYTDAAKLEPEKPAYLAEWSQPGAMTAMLNWYRASAILVPAPGETPERPAWLDAPFPPVTQPTLVIWAMQDTALLPVQLDGLEALVPDLTVVRIAGAGHFVPWEKPELVNEAILEWLA
ncbi:pimeloyl-ACP methyl ester carboxylesterase [Sphingomonas kyeonggiensis]|uniref:Pimeloyl-ACP methyl ester carboxylesterase n=1 Tax=Sphingomonas kyeonggiensis TaxID=1268553 RepID=A0A7W7JXB4_9SPHN|nr:alpha/beta hydrolase [Sphingomonas kyeonggiensis]MBB4837089.1 pimeloyl-ACP methyl ester carboxylesterase [Sphingomonas kyeonggiensis]